MIGRLRGVLVSSLEGRVLIEVGGVGYEVLMTPRDIAQLPGVGEEIVVHTHTHVREDEISLFGFGSESDRDLFRVLLTASGVGPKLAIAMLASMTGEELIRAIIRDDSDALTIAPGVGKRGAQKIVLELAPKLASHGAEPGGGGGNPVRSALESLGYTTAEINGVVADLDPAAPVAEQIREALKSLGSA